MTAEPGKTHIHLELTPCQKQQIREATGREINTLELRLASLPEPAGPSDQEEQHMVRGWAGSVPGYPLDSRAQRRPRPAERKVTG